MWKLSSVFIMKSLDFCVSNCFKMNYPWTHIYIHTHNILFIYLCRSFLYSRLGFFPSYVLVNVDSIQAMSTTKAIISCFTLGEMQHVMATGSPAGSPVQLIAAMILSWWLRHPLLPLMKHQAEMLAVSIFRAITLNLILKRFSDKENVPICLKHVRHEITVGTSV